jgi:hypothetical protein
MSGNHRLIGMAALSQIRGINAPAAPAFHSFLCHRIVCRLDQQSHVGAVKITLRKLSKGEPK